MSAALGSRQELVPSPAAQLLSPLVLGTNVTPVPPAAPALLISVGLGPDADGKRLLTLNSHPLV